MNVEEEELREALASDKKKFISVGRFSKEKGHARLIKAFEILHKEQPDTLLFILGGYGVLYNDTKKWAAESSCPEAIFVIGFGASPTLAEIRNSALSIPFSQRETSEKSTRNSI